jgi:CRP-like cAMP-binding protein
LFGAPPGIVCPAREWAEDRLLEADGTIPTLPEMCVLRDHTLLRDLTDDEYERLLPLLEHRTFAAGDRLLHRGDTATEILLVTSGHISVIVPVADGGWRRLSTISAGLVLGEAAALGGVRRIADARADRPGDCYVLTAGTLEALDASDPALKNALLRALLRCTHDTLSGMSRSLPRG